MSSTLNKAKTSQADRVWVVTRELLRSHFSDGKWRTADDMSGVLRDVIADEAAGRAKSLPTRGRLSLAEQIQANKTYMVLSCVSAMVRAGYAESRPGQYGGHKQFRLTDKKVHATIRRGPSVEDLSRPGDTKSGITRPVVHALIAVNPGITKTDLVKLLEPCFKKEGTIESYVTSRPPGRREGLTDDYEGAKLYAVGQVLNDLKTGGGTRSETVVRYFAT